jgi:hypothetical protein
VRQYSHRLTVWCASPIFKPIAYKLSFTNRKRKYFEEQTTATLKIKQTSIATFTSQLPDPPHFLLVTTFKEPLDDIQNHFDNVIRLAVLRCQKLLVYRMVFENADSSEVVGEWNPAAG